MDRSLDEIISERPERPRGGGRGRGGRGGGGGGGGDRRPPPPRAPRREDYPRDGVRKYRRDEPANLDSDWVHDRYEDERQRYDRRAPAQDERFDSRSAGPPSSRIRVDNIHYDLTEDDLRELFERIGPVTAVRMTYDRSDRSTGTAFVTYDDDRDAAQAVRDFDNQMANGQAIRITLMASGPPPQPAHRGSLFDRIEPAPRSLFDRIDNGPPGRRDDGRRRQRSDSPRKAGRLAPDVDRYVPGGRRGGSRSPIRRRGTPREGGRRPGAKREEGAAGGGRGGRRARTDEEGRPLVGGRPRKTAEELDAEMNDYWGSANNGDGEAAPAAGNGDAPAANGGGDIDMDI
ncbi:uncharacterized protein RCC_06610 [Ramularia collo-cygni]|uniref:RRM domain-containing protein n=1 Tax=Ramularia collo-cygni TaxID=112498 RepID=A0A2D3VIR9_9PEZI|nr:uncharacterized protein RCC_06610 [Ramularia collo-cygni]CZT20753.1 uncharacterized protein RCC_06610 [Ramularia collo-cygni]